MNSNTSPVVATDSVAGASNSTPEVLVISRESIRQTHKAKLAAEVKTLCDKHGLDSVWLKGLGTNGIAKLCTYFDMVTIEDKAAFCATYSPVDVTETLLPSLIIAKEAEEKAVQKALEVQTAEAPRPKRTIYVCACTMCDDNPRKALKGFDGDFRFPTSRVAEKILGRPATLEDLPRLAVHKMHDFVMFIAGEHIWLAEAKKHLEQAAADQKRLDAQQKAYDDEKIEATKHLNGRQFLVALELGYWLKIGKGNDSVVLLVSEALVPEKRYVVGKERGEFSPAMLAICAVPVWSDLRSFERIGVQLFPLDEVLGQAFPNTFPQFVAAK